MGRLGGGFLSVPSSVAPFHPADFSPLVPAVWIAGSVAVRPYLAWAFALVYVGVLGTGLRSPALPPVPSCAEPLLTPFFRSVCL